MKITEKRLRQIIRKTINEIGDTSSNFRQMKYVPSGDDRRFGITSVSKESMRDGEISQSDAVKLMSASMGFFQTLVDSIRFGFLTRAQVNKICDSLSTGCEDNFRNIAVTHPCLMWWKNDVAKIAQRIGENSSFKIDFCESIKSNCEMVKSNYNKLPGNFKNVRE